MNPCRSFSSVCELFLERGEELSERELVKQACKWGVHCAGEGAPMGSMSIDTQTSHPRFP